MELVVQIEVDRLKSLGYDAIIENEMLTVEQTQQHFDNLDFMVLTGIHLPYSLSINGVNPLRVYLLSRTESKSLELSNSELVNGFIVREKLAVKVYDHRLNAEANAADVIPFYLTFTRVIPVKKAQIQQIPAKEISKPR